MLTAKLLPLLDELFELDAGTVTVDSVLKELPGWSSLTFVGLIALIDEEFGVAMPPNVILGCRTAGELSFQLGNKLDQRAAA